MLSPLFLGGLGYGEILLIAFIVLLLFGGKKIPEMMRGLGKGVRSYKDAVSGKNDPDDETGATTSQPEQKAS